MMFAILIVVGCSKKTSAPTGCTDSTGLTCPGPAEVAYCSSTTAYSNSVTITGTAQYIRREPFAGGLGNASLTGATHPAQAYPIRYAEVRVLNSAGKPIQCATTATNGTFSFQLPKSSSTFTVQVNSRAFNSKLRASVLDAPLSNKFYSLTKTVAPTANKSIGTLTATASGATLGGAFNILDQFAFANDYLRAKAGNCSAISAQCTNFTVAPKVSAYWIAGFNPYSYYGGTSGVSFYLPGYSRLFILGGINGDMGSSDTDHYDNSVVIHEYGHFLEDSMFASDSPGGFHNGNAVIDPRLAWSEGWGNFFQAAVTNWSGYGDAAYATAEYIDTIGNADGTSTVGLSVDLETPDAYDEPDFQGEGNFREFAVSRFLWDVVDTGTDAGAVDGISDEFGRIWAALTKSSLSFKDSNMKFRNVGLLHLVENEMTSNMSTWNAIRTLNMHDPDQSEYAQYVRPSGNCSYTITPANISTDDGSLDSSDLFRNNDFYHLRIATAGTYTIRLDYEDANAMGDVADLDLYVYNESAQFAVGSDILAYKTSRPTQTPTANQVESVSVTLPKGDYLINVNVFTGGILGTEAEYTLKLNGSKLCPANLVQ